MPLAFVMALAASLGIHLAALFGTDVELFGGGDDPPPLQAELKAPPKPAVPESSKAKSTPKTSAVPAAKAQVRPAHPIAHEQAGRPVLTSPAQDPVAVNASAASTEPALDNAQIGPDLPSTVTSPAPAPAPAKAVLPAAGVIRYVIYFGTQKFEIGRAEHRWQFTEDGRYQLNGTTVTTGLVALFKSVRFENESRGKLVATGLQPEQYLTRKNGQASNENADFDWAAGTVRLARDGSVRELQPGAQDILSLNYQLAYLAHPEAGTQVGVVTGKKYERYALDSLGEESLDTPAGRFRTLHLRATTENVTEIWIALDRHRLPVKIRFTDRKGDIYEQVATELGAETATAN